jgi:hypothetical protein
MTCFSIAAARGAALDIGWRKQFQSWAREAVKVPDIGDICHRAVHQMRRSSLVVVIHS